LPWVACELNPTWTISPKRTHWTTSGDDAGSKGPGPMADSFPQRNLFAYAAVARVYNILAIRKSHRKWPGVSIPCAITQSAGEPLKRLCTLPNPEVERLGFRRKNAGVKKDTIERKTMNVSRKWLAFHGLSGGGLF
jgi:hypothetical protein